MKRCHLEAILVSSALDVIRAAASAAGRTETGGLLLGWWEGDAIVARYAIEVPDPDATSSSWTRADHRAQDALDRALADLDHPWLGYVGDWHTHPARCGPSSQDEQSICNASHGYSQPLLLLVHRNDGTIEARSADQGHLRPLTIHHWSDDR
ncbi:Mov34/MPN/PAD-1 family protein [Streptomyces prunicolor]|uniref:Mov34/MPN/PAD-1 family protein n=1 Tax=Streptomyces prunicolor TaxID=67348 RepID=UPI001319E2F7|nr:Mov34/MPN/PAD-1 family protein [Streptomyces prunicolor]